MEGLSINWLIVDHFCQMLKVSEDHLFRIFEAKHFIVMCTYLHIP